MGDKGSIDQWTDSDEWEQVEMKEDTASLISSDGDTLLNYGNSSDLQSLSTLDASILSTNKGVNVPHPLSRQQSVEGHLFDGKDFDDELAIKERRFQAKNNPNTCKGKTRRRKCCCNSCRERMEGRVVAMHPGRRMVENNGAPVTEFDLLDLPVSLNKAKNWSVLREALAEVAFSSGVSRRSGRNRDIRRVEIFSVPVAGKIVTAAMQERATMETAELSEGTKHDMKKMKPDTYYIARGAPRHFTIEVDDSLSEYVKEIASPPLVQLRDGEEYADFVPSFFSRYTKQEKGTKLSPLMIAHENVRAELESVAKQAKHGGFYWGYYDSQVTSDHCYRSCWASEAVLTGTRTAMNDYDDWFLDIDLRRERQIEGVVIQGRAPKVETFPTASCFRTSEAGSEIAKYKGVFWPVVNQTSWLDPQYVSRVEIMCRRERGVWFSLGTYKANEDCLTQVRLNIDLVFPVRYVRIRPLSKRHGGFVGLAPAMRCGIIAKVDKNSDVKSGIATQNQGGIADEGFIKYELLTPDQSVMGVHPSAKFVGGTPAINQCSTASHYKSLNKTENTRYQKRKAFQLLVNDADTYEDDVQDEEETSREEE